MKSSVSSQNNPAIMHACEIMPGHGTYFSQYIHIIPAPALLILVFISSLKM